MVKIKNKKLAKLLEKEGGISASILKENLDQLSESEQRDLIGIFLHKDKNASRNILETAKKKIQTALVKLQYLEERSILLNKTYSKSKYLP
ncbi:MAG: hypothetical protein ACD_28C00076G0004 [uncultured bacterium]|nr:MAG: hypothetical protein ACD_28C00076G0004 [uncultured bacterium]KKT75833.1 MAG: hypothetical protein UW70_C0027G0019 [Candidatus Peregrinibacteria bacterium GW2011_GWA2_44_7]